MSKLRHTTGFVSTVRPELKYSDIDLGSIDMVSLATPLLINGLAVGAGDGARVGSKILLKSVNIKGYTAPYSSGAGGTIGEIVLILDKAPTSSIPAAADIFTSYGAMGLLKMSVRDRFTILLRKQVNLPVYTTATTGYTNNRVDIFKMLNIPVTYKDVGATVASIQQNAVYCLFWANATAPNVHHFAGQARLRYSDA